MSNERVEARINLSAVRYNMESMRRNIGENVKMTAVVKTDGYGHGACRIAEELEKLPYLWGFAVATFEEALELRNHGINRPILILGYVFPYCYEQLSQLEIRPAVFREDMIPQLAEAAKKTGKRLRVHVAVDTGMTRIGIRPDESGLAFIRGILDRPELELEGLFTHFARADEKSRSATLIQAEKFRKLISSIEESGYHVPICHCSNSAGIISYPEMNMNMVRAGITLYGLWPSEEVPRDIVPLRPVMSLVSHIVYIKTVPAGVPVSYGGTYVTDHETRVATIPVGYGDGYPRSLSGKGYVLIRGQKAPILGRVCMDQMMVCVDHIPEATEGDEVTLIGQSGEKEISMEELGKLSGRFNYELACDINRRVPRKYVYK